MKNKVYGGLSFPFVITVRMGFVNWILMAAVLTPPVLLILGFAAIVWCLL